MCEHCKRVKKEEKTSGLPFGIGSRRNEGKQLKEQRKSKVIEKERKAEKYILFFVVTFRDRSKAFSLTRK